MEEILRSQLRLSLAPTAGRWWALPFMLSHQDAFFDADPKSTGINNVLKVLKKSQAKINLSSSSFSQISVIVMESWLTHQTIHRQSGWNKKVKEVWIFCPFPWCEVYLLCLQTSEFRSSYVAFENTEHWPSSSQIKTPGGILVFQLTEGKRGNFSTSIIM